MKYLKVENEILRGKLPGRIVVTPQERNRLVKFAQKLGARPCSSSRRSCTRHAAPLDSGGEEGRQANAGQARPSPDAEQIRRLILKLAKENEWGYTRILGELKKLGIVSISRNTVKRILNDAGLDPGPQRGEGTWDEFLKQHAASLWQCDFFSQRVLTLKGIREAFVLAFLNVKTRQVILSPATLHPDEAWTVAQAASFVKQARERGLPVRHVQRDRDSKFTKSFDRELKSCQVKPMKNAFRSPNTNAFVERFIQSIRPSASIGS